MRMCIIKSPFRVELGNMNLLLILLTDFVGFRQTEMCLMSLLETYSFGLYPVVPQNTSKVLNILYTVCTVMSEGCFHTSTFIAYPGSIDVRVWFVWMM